MLGTVADVAVEIPVKTMSLGFDFKQTLQGGIDAGSADAQVGVAGVPAEQDAGGIVNKHHLAGGMAGGVDHLHLASAAQVEDVSFLQRDQPGQRVRITGLFRPDIVASKEPKAAIMAG